jgi:hypothetical protein
MSHRYEGRKPQYPTHPTLGTRAEGPRPPDRRVAGSGREGWVQRWRAEVDRRSKNHSSGSGLRLPIPSGPAVDEEAVLRSTDAAEARLCVASRRLPWRGPHRAGSVQFPEGSCGIGASFKPHDLIASSGRLCGRTRPCVALALGRAGGRSKPQRHLGRLHRLVDHTQQLNQERVEVDLLAQPVAEVIDGIGGVVAAPVEASVDRALDAAPQACFPCAACPTPMSCSGEDSTMTTCAPCISSTKSAKAPPPSKPLTSPPWSSESLPGVPSRPRDN